MVSDADVIRAAREMVDRYGQRALIYANERVEAVVRSGDQPSLSVALRVLTEVERLVGVGRRAA
jgi:hypothetical protein